MSQLDDLRQQLLSMRARDEEVRAELATDGSLFEGYHPRMEQIHRANAEALEALIQKHGWPHEALAGADGAEAAWLIAQHAIGEVAFMRRCRKLLDEASSRGFVPRWQFAYIDDRIRAFEGKPQRYGTQIDMRPEGPVPLELEDASQVEAWRREAGLSPLDAALARTRGEPRPTAQEYAALQSAGLTWRRKAGWLDDLPS